MRPIRMRAAWEVISLKKIYLGITASAKSIHEAGTEGNNVLQSTTELDTDGIVDQLGTEVLGVEENLADFGVLTIGVTRNRGRQQENTQ